MARHKNKFIAVLLWFFTGFIGGHRFYLGSPMRGVFFIGLLVLGSQLDEAGRSEDQLVFYLVVLLWLYDLYWILSSPRSEESGELQETQRMSFLKKLFGKKESRGVPDLEDLGLEVEVAWGDDGEELSADDYCHNHCFIFYGLNEEAFSNIEREVQEYDGPDALSLLRSAEGVVMTSLFEQPAGSEDVLGPNSELVDYVDKVIDHHIEQISDNFGSAIGEECIGLVKTEKPFIAGGIAAAAKAWSESDHFKKEGFIGAMLLFVKSSKSFDPNDSASNEQTGFNLPVVTRNGFLRSCIYDCEETNSIKFVAPHDEAIETFWYEFSPKGGNPINQSSYGMPFSFEAPFGLSYFDQDGRLWGLDQIGKAVTLHWESEDETDFYVSH